MRTLPRLIGHSGRRVISLLLVLMVGISSVEVAWAEAFSTNPEEMACVSASPERAPQSSPCSAGGVSVPDDHEDCACLCACSCAGAQRAIFQVPAISVSGNLTRFPLPLDKARTPLAVAPAPHFRPPVGSPS